MAHEPIAYTFEADNHCPDCTESRFGRSMAGWIAEDAQDAEGNEIGAVAPWSEWWNAGSNECETLSCGTCRAEIATAHAVDCTENLGAQLCTLPGNRG